MPPQIPIIGNPSEIPVTRHEFATFPSGQGPAVMLHIGQCPSCLDPGKEIPILIQLRSGLVEEYTITAPKGPHVLPVSMNITLAEFQKKCEDYVTELGCKLGPGDRKDKDRKEIVWGGVKVLWESPVERLWPVEGSESLIDSDKQLEAALSLLVIRGHRDRFLVFFDKG